MLDNIIQWSLRNRLLVIALAVALIIYGGGPPRNYEHNWTRSLANA